MNREDRALVKETKALIKEVESGNTVHAAWVAVQDRVRRLYQDRTQPEVGDLLGKSRDWVARTLAWERVPGSTPFGGKTAEQKGRGMVEAKKVAVANPDALLDDPEARASIEQALTERQLQEHPATATRVPTGMPEERSYGFSVEMGGPSQALQRAVDNYVEAWEEYAPDASEEELQVERDLVAPKLLSLRMTVEGIPA